MNKLKFWYMWFYPVEKERERSQTMLLWLKVMPKGSN